MAEYNDRGGDVRERVPVTSSRAMSQALARERAFDAMYRDRDITNARARSFLTEMMEHNPETIEKRLKDETTTKLNNTFQLYMKYKKQEIKVNNLVNLLTQMQQNPDDFKATIGSTSRFDQDELENRAEEEATKFDQVGRALSRESDNSSEFVENIKSALNKYGTTLFSIPRDKIKDMVDDMTSKRRHVAKLIEEFDHSPEMQEMVGVNVIFPSYSTDGRQTPIFSEFTD